jgi:hypothetical protein
VGIGVARCEFCDGSGWVTLEYVPESLRPVVIRSRAVLAMQRMKALLERPVPRVTASEPDKAIKRCSQLLLNLDRQMGVFENVVVSLAHLPASDGAKAKLRSLMGKCGQIATKGEDRIRDTILCLGEAYRAKAKTAGKGSKAREQAGQQAEFYVSLVDADRTLAGTGLEQPFLRKTVNETVRRSGSTRHSAGSGKKQPSRGG